MLTVSQKKKKNAWLPQVHTIRENTGLNSFFFFFLVTTFNFCSPGGFPTKKPLEFGKPTPRLRFLNDWQIPVGDFLHQRRCTMENYSYSLLLFTGWLIPVLMCWVTAHSNTLSLHLLSHLVLSLSFLFPSPLIPPICSTSPPTLDNSVVFPFHQYYTPFQQFRACIFP